jgi:hypothetical protein
MPCACAPDRCTLLRNFSNHAQWQWRTHTEDKDNPGEREQRVDPLAGSLLQLTIMQKIQGQGEMREEYRTIWKRLWWNYNPGLRILATRTYHDKDHKGTAAKCLTLIEQLEPCGLEGNSDEDFSAWAKSFKVEGSVFDDGFIRDLMAFMPSNEDIESTRVRRLRVLDAAASKDSSANAAPRDEDKSEPPDLQSLMEDNPQAES